MKNENENDKCANCYTECLDISLETATYREGCCLCEGIPKYEYCELCEDAC